MVADTLGSKSPNESLPALLPFRVMFVFKDNYPKYHLHRVTDHSTLVNKSTKIKLQTCLRSTKISGNVYVYYCHLVDKLSFYHKTHN